MCRSPRSSFLDRDVIQVFARTGRADGEVQAATLATEPAAVEAAARHGLAAAGWAQDVGVVFHVRALGSQNVSTNGATRDLSPPPPDVYVVRGQRVTSSWPILNPPATPFAFATWGNAR